MEILIVAAAIAVTVVVVKIFLSRSSVVETYKYESNVVPFAPYKDLGTIRNPEETEEERRRRDEPVQLAFPFAVPQADGISYEPSNSGDTYVPEYTPQTGRAEAYDGVQSFDSGSDSSAGGGFTD